VLFDYFNCVSTQDGQPVLNNRLEAELKRIFDSSRYWGEGGSDPIRSYVPERAQIEFLVGLPEVPTEKLPETDRTRISARRDAIKNFLSTKVDAAVPFSFHDVPETSEIIFYTELSGVPLTYYNGMYDLRSSYRQAQTTDPALHLESKEASKFEDVLILTNEEMERFQAAWQCLVQGAMLGEIWVKPGTTKPEFGYTEVVRGVRSEPRIGEERAAIVYLQTRTDITQRLLTRTQDSIARLIADLRSGDQPKVDNAQQMLLGMSLLAILRMEELSKSTGNDRWYELPMYPKMEYLSMKDLNDRIHRVADWDTFNSDLDAARAKVNSFAEKRLDGRYALKLKAAAPASGVK
jgi:hypothetical protein